MTSAMQTSSRKPPVGQSTFGFPDDPPRSADFSPPRTSSTHRLSVGMLTPPAHPPSSPSRSWRPARLSALQKMHEALSSPVLCLAELGGRPSGSRKNVEKLSFGPHRLACTSKAKKIFHPPFLHFTRPQTVPLSSLQSASFLAKARAIFSPSLSVRSVSSALSVSFCPTPKCRKTFISAPCSRIFSRVSSFFFGQHSRHFVPLSTFRAIFTPSKICPDFRPAQPPPIPVFQTKCGLAG